MKKQIAALLVAALLVAALDGVLAAAGMTCEGECDAAFSGAVAETTANFDACVETAGAILCSGFLVILAGQMAAWGVCKAGCAGPYIMSAVRREQVVA